MGLITKLPMGRKYKLPRGEKRLWWSFLFFMIFVMGALLNSVVVFENDCRMPVPLDYHLKTDRHISYKNSLEIKYYYLADILKLETSKDIIYFSIGDVIIIFGAFASIIFIILWKKDLKKRREEFRVSERNI